LVTKKVAAPAPALRATTTDDRQEEEKEGWPSGGRRRRHWCCGDAICVRICVEQVFEPMSRAWMPLFVWRKDMQTGPGETITKNPMCHPWFTC
jgi:hypothetical protein